jgi:hypothetical protein
MGRAILEKNNKGEEIPYFYGTETGAFACLDGFSEHAKMQMEGEKLDTISTQELTLDK